MYNAFKLILETIRVQNQCLVSLIYNIPKQSHTKPNNGQAYRIKVLKYGHTYFLCSQIF